MPDSVQLSQHILGMEPYVLVRVTGSFPDDPESTRVVMELGGGLDKATAYELLKTILDDSEEV